MTGVRLRRPTTAQLKRLADAARDWAAILFTPVLTLFAAWLVWILVWAGWPAGTAEQRITFLGLGLLGLLGLIGFGAFFYQRRTVNARVETPAGSVEVEDVSQGPAA